MGGGGSGFSDGGKPVSECVVGGNVVKPTTATSVKKIQDSSNEQNPFKSLDEWNESEHPRDDEGKFSSTGGGNSNGSKEEKEKLSNVYKINNKEYKQIDLPYNEWKKVDSAIRTNFPNKKNGMLKKGVFPYVYTIIFKKGDFIIVDKVDSDNDFYD